MTPNLIVSELLASAKNAIDTGKPIEDIASAFTHFYSDKEVTTAREVIAATGVDLGRSGRGKSGNAAKEASILEVLKTLVDSDFKGKNTIFCAVQLNRIHFVPDGLQDDIQMRSEIASVHQKMDDLLASYQNAVSTMASVKEDIAKLTPNMETSLENHGTSAPPAKTTYAATVAKPVTTKNNEKK